jgi:peptide chain release factor 2
LLPFHEALEKFHYLEESAQLLAEEGGEVFQAEIKTGLEELKKRLEELELMHLLSGEMDRNSAILMIHPGAGGTESQDWAQILMRLYLRWAERHGFTTKILDLQPGDEAGIKSVTISVEGPYAYGHLRTESGVHRLVRISPFDAAKRRHTSFTAVMVFPEVEGDIDIEIRDEDIKMDTFRASGAGGQHVNKTSSAVRLTHIPTGIVVSCQNERSQYRNREVAMKILKARLFELELREREKKMEEFKGEKRDIAWGSQIRSYVLQPYRLVKDHRTDLEIGNVDAVLDGDIDPFIQAVLKKNAREKQSLSVSKNNNLKKNSSSRE